MCAFTFGAIRPTTFSLVALLGFAFVAGFFFFAVFFAGFVIGFFAFNDAAARFSFPVIAFRADGGTAEPAAARAALRFRRIVSRLAFRRSFGSRYGTSQK